MEELDYLKKHWNKEASFPKINKDDIRKMLHKSSYSILKWILIACSAEFVLGISLKIYYIFFDPNQMKNYDIVLEIISIIATGYFLILFFKEYGRIKTFVDTKSLMNSILKARSWVKMYITLTIAVIAIQWIIGITDNSIYEAFKTGYTSDGSTRTDFSTTEIIVILSLTFTFISLLLFLYYRLVYIRLIQKLKYNYEELARLEA